MYECDLGSRPWVKETGFPGAAGLSLLTFTRLNELVLFFYI